MGSLEHYNINWTNKGYHNLSKVIFLLLVIVTIFPLVKGENPVISQSVIYPTTAYYNNTLLGYCNATDGDRGTMISYDSRWYLNNEVYEENIPEFISAGYDHTCAINLTKINSSPAYCWGRNNEGQLGNGSTKDATVAIPINSTSYFISVSSGREHSCAINRNGTAYCWGRSEYGQLGTGSLVDNNNPKPVNTTTSPLGFKKVSAGGYHTCGILKNGTAYCWGYNNLGQLGNGSASNSAYPVAVNLSSLFKTISSGESHTCGILTNGSAYCWGSNSKGQLGNGSSSGNSLAPLPVNLLSKFKAISSGESHTCGILANGTAYCWGEGNSGRLGYGGTSIQSSPKAVNLAHPFKMISAGGTHSCGILMNGSVYCWGDNGYGQLGTGDLLDKSIPTPVVINWTLSQITTGNKHTCGVLMNGTTYCWGYNYYGQLGNSTADSINSLPLMVKRGNNNFTMVPLYANKILSYVTNITYGLEKNQVWKLECIGNDADNYTLALNSSPLIIYGFNEYKPTVNQSLIFPATAYYNDTLNGYCNATDGDNDTMSYNSRWYLNERLYEENIPYYISAGISHTCGILTNGSAYCWGDNTDGQLGNGTTTNSFLPIPVNISKQFRLISSGESHTCGILTNGSAYCWGMNNFGQIGNDAEASYRTPVAILNNLLFKILSTGYSHTCGILTNGSAYCWGSGDSGQLGNGESYDQSLPTAVTLAGNFKTLSSGGFHTCGILTNGSAYCWGRNEDGQLGDAGSESQYNPTAVNTAYLFKSISAGNQHTCGVLLNGSGYCWGDNYNGQLGNGRTTDSSSPVGLNLSNLKMISAGGYHTCALLQNGTAYCWGLNNYGQVGNATSTSSTTNVNKVPMAVNRTTYYFESISAGKYHTCGISINGSAYCWGYNNVGQIGDGTTRNYNVTTGVNSSSTMWPLFTQGVSVPVGNITYGVEIGQTWTLECRATDSRWNSSWYNSTLLAIGQHIPVIRQSLILPVVASYNDTLQGYCNATDADNINLTYSWKWYKDGILNATGNESEIVPGWRYQETANSSTSGCPDWKDNDWDTFCNWDLTYEYFNYTKPLGATNTSLLQLKTADGILNYTIPDTCFQQSKLMFSIYDEFSGTEYNANLLCWDGGEWAAIDSIQGDIYEEAMWWNLSALSHTQGDLVHIDDLDTGLVIGQNWKFECTAYDGIDYSSSLNSSSLNIGDTFFPTVTFTDLLNNSFTGSSEVLIEVYVDKESSNCSYTIDQIEYEDMTEDTPYHHASLDLDDGSYNLTVICTANEVYSSSANLNNLTVDTLEPSITIESPTNYSTVLDMVVEFNFLITEDNVDKAWYTENINTTKKFISPIDTETNNYYNIDFEYPGKETIIIYGNDTLGNIGFANVTIYVDNLIDISIWEQELLDHIDSLDSIEVFDSSFVKESDSIALTEQSLELNFTYIVVDIYNFTSLNVSWGSFFEADDSSLSFEEAVNAQFGNYPELFVTFSNFSRFIENSDDYYAKVKLPDNISQYASVYFCPGENLLSCSEVNACSSNSYYETTSTACYNSTNTNLFVFAPSLGSVLAFTNPSLSDFTAPVVTVTAPLNNSNLTTSYLNDLTFTTNENATCKYSLNTNNTYVSLGSTPARSFSASFTSYSTRYHNISINCTDLYGNMGHTRVYFWINDTTAPEVSRSITTTLSSIKFDLETDEPANHTLILVDESTKTNSTFSTTHFENFTGLDEGTTYTYNIIVCDRFRNCRNVTSTKKTSTTSSDSPGGSPGGSPVGGNTTSTVSKVSQVWQSPEAGEYNLNIPTSNIAFTQIGITLKRNISGNILFTIEKISSLPGNLPSISNSYQFIKIDKTVITDSDLSDLLFKFRVEKSWFTSNNINPNSVALYRYTNKWDKLTTRQKSSDSNYYYYEAESPGMSYFAIQGEKIVQTQTPPPETPPPEQPETPDDTDENIPPPQENPRNVDEEPKGSFLPVLITFIVIAVLVSGVVIFMMTKHQEGIMTNSPILSSSSSMPQTAAKSESTVQDYAKTIEEYVEKCKSEGIPFKDIKSSLLLAGWQESLIDEVMSKIDLPKSDSDKIKDYIIEMKKYDKTDEEIKNGLKSAGWQDDIINEFFQRK